MGDRREILIKIPDENWPELRDMYRKDWPYFIYFYNFLDFSYKWKTKHRYAIEIYSYNGKWREDGTFISIYKVIYNPIYTFAYKR